MGGTVFFAIPGDIETPTGGYGYDRRLIAELPKLGWRVEHVVLPDGFPDPTPGTLAATAAVLGDLPDGSLLLVDGLAYGAMPDLVADLAKRARLVALVHHPLVDETGLIPADAERLEESERRALRFAREVICTSRTTAERLISGFAVEPERLTVAVPGTERHPRAQGNANEPIILSLAAVVRRKGHDILIQALSQVTGRPWICRIVGPLNRDPEWAAYLKAQTDRLGLSDRTLFTGPVSSPENELQAADIFALPSRHEGYGMAFAEALAHGLPIVACKAGAVPEVVPPEAGLLVPVDDPDALAAALAALLDDRDRRGRMGEAAWRAGQALPGWEDTARLVAQALERAAR
jgi:glycosyltransferase involved in cell wall biosynthesis